MVDREPSKFLVLVRFQHLLGEKMIKTVRKENPIISLVNSVFIDLPAPSNLSYLWNYGSLLGICLIMQIVTGIFLAMHYCAEAHLAFSSVAYLTQESFVLRFWHANCTSMFFLSVYIHIGRGIFYGSYTKIIVWNVGVLLYVLMMATAFIGYVLPWGQMSF